MIEILQTTESEKWKKATILFQEFWMQANKTNIPTHVEIGSLQAMFLNEKPAVLGNKFATDNMDYLKSCGYKFAGNIVYDPLLVQEVIQNNQTIFRVSEEANKLVEKLSSGDTSMQERDTKLGLVLGFPLSAVAKYQTYSNMLYFIKRTRADITTAIFDEWVKSGNNSTAHLADLIEKQAQVLGIDKEKIDTFKDLTRNTKYVDIYGIYWTEFGNTSEESLTKQKRLKAAFETSGIKDIVKNYLEDYGYIDFYKCTLS